MLQETIEQLAETIREKALAWRGAQSDEEKWIVESQLGEEVFREIFAQDTTILGPWQLRTKGKRKEEKYEAFKVRWDALFASDDLGLSSKDLLAWCRCAGLRRLMNDNGLDSDQFGWPELWELQRAKSVNQMLEKARTATEERFKEETDLQPEEQAWFPQSEPPEAPAPAQQESNPRPDLSASLPPEVPSEYELPKTDPKAPATVAELDRILEQPTRLLTSPAFMQLMADPANFKDLSPIDREHLRGRVEKIACEMESFARSFRDFEAVLRWSRRM